MSAEEIGLVHCSGPVKPWHYYLQPKVEDLAQGDSQLRAVEHRLSPWHRVQDFVEHLLQRSCERYDCWVTRTAASEKYAEHGCALVGGRVFVRAGQGSEEDVTALLKETADLLHAVAQKAVTVWLKCAETLSLTQLNALVCPGAPPGGICVGERVKVFRGSKDNAVDADGADAIVVSVQPGERYVVRYVELGVVILNAMWLRSACKSEGCPPPARPGVALH